MRQLPAEEVRRVRVLGLSREERERTAFLRPIFPPREREGFFTVGNLLSEMSCLNHPMPAREQRFEWTSLADPEPSWSDVRYDFRLYDEAYDEVERAEGLSEPTYAPRRPLESGVTYFWTFRARFAEGAKTRVTPWEICESTHSSRFDIELRRTNDLNVGQYFPVFIVEER